MASKPEAKGACHRQFEGLQEAWARPSVYCQCMAENKGSGSATSQNYQPVCSKQLGRELHKQDAQSSALSDGRLASLISSSTYINIQRSHAGADCMTQTL